MNKPGDLMGQTFGRLKVMERAQNSAAGAARWLCQCSFCGIEKPLLGCDLRHRLRHRDGQSCFCGVGQPPIDLTGQVFDRLTVLERAPNKGRSACWLCRCSCGSETIVRGTSLRRGESRSCGCIRVNDLTGRVFGHLKVIQAAPRKSGAACWLCVCDCGVKKAIRASSLIDGLTRSCGCRMGGKKAQTFQGVPCAKGHSGLRYVKDRGCVECVRLRNKSKKPASTTQRSAEGGRTEPCAA